MIFYLVFQIDNKFGKL